jgi:hypothetical protein
MEAAFSYNLAVNRIMLDAAKHIFLLVAKTWDQYPRVKVQAGIFLVCYFLIIFERVFPLFTIQAYITCTAVTTLSESITVSEMLTVINAWHRLINCINSI